MKKGAGLQAIPLNIVLKFRMTVVFFFQEALAFFSGAVFLSFIGVKECGA